MADDVFDEARAHRDLQNQLDWYADQAQEFEAAARRLDAICEKALYALDNIHASRNFEGAMKQISTARDLLRHRHQQR